MNEILKKIEELDVEHYSNSYHNFCYARAINDVRKIILAEQKETCTYIKDDETNAWECDKCGLTWVFMESYTTPEENDMNFCPKCGRPIK